MRTNSTVVFDLIEDIASNSSKNDKTSLLSAALGDANTGHFVRRVLDYTYNPFKRYGVRKLPAVTVSASTEDAEFNESTWNLLDDLKDRLLTGSAAQEAIAQELQRLNPKPAELLRRIIRKDLRAGFGESTISKVAKGLIPSFPYMRCSLPSHTDLTKWDWERGIISQEKADGMFANVNLDSAGAQMTSRQGTPFPDEGFEDLLAEVEQRFDANTQTHGEILVCDPNGKILAREIGNGMINSVLQGGSWPEGHYPTLQVWDQIPLSVVTPKGKYDMTYERRLGGLHLSLKAIPGKLISLVPTKIVYSLKEAYAHYKELLLSGKEGTIIKRREMIWRDHTSKDQIKLKLEADCELEVLDFVPGDETGKHKDTFGSLRCGSSCRKLIVDVAGFKDDKRLEIHKKGEAYKGTILTVRSNAILYSDNLEKKAHSLFLPRFVDERFDKSVADDLVRIEEQFANAIDLVGID